MSEVRPPQPCGLYRPGHDPHWIQARRGWEDGSNPPVTGRLVDARDDGTVVIDVNGELRRLWNHEPARLAEAAARSGGVVMHQPRWGLLKNPSESGHYLFCVADDGQEHQGCPDRPPTGTPIELLKSAGGFIVPASELRRSS
ncbi:MAG: hypothetical protein ACHQBP_05975 [Acidimicrobiales bacterium]